MKDRIADWDIRHFDDIDSTNAEAKRRAREGLIKKTLFVADRQSAGRGRMDRRWESPAGAGLWMTQLVSPRGVRASDAGGAVFISAVALADTINALTGARALIKWPNDIVLNGKKLCGMLAECGFDSEMCAWIALGTGLNLAKDALPDELIYASSIEKETGLRLDRETILEKYLPAFDELMKVWETEGLAPVIRLMEPLSATIDRDVRVNGEYAHAVRIDPDGALVCRFEDGESRVIAGDVSVRGITDYV